MHPHSSSSTQPVEFRKDGTISKMRSHKGNIPVLPQTKLCPHCPAKFTRTTHLNRHLRTHTNERLHRCDNCGSQFTRSDLLTRHKRSCNDPLNANRTRRRSCQACADSKIKCDLQYPCSKCISRGKECVFSPPGANTGGNRSTWRKPSEENIIVSRLKGNSSPESGSTDSSLSTPSPLPSLFSFAAEPRMVEECDLFNDSVSSAAAYRMLDQDSHSTTTPPLWGDVDSVDRFYSAFGPDLDAFDSNGQSNTMFSNDLSEPFFGNIFSESPASGSPPISVSGQFLWERDVNVPGNSFIPRPIDTPAYTHGSGIEDGDLFESLINSSVFSTMANLTQRTPVVASPRQPKCTEALRSHEAEAAELQHYLHLFFTAFLSQFPIMHPATFKMEGRPIVLLSAMYACGALFVKTKRASVFVTRTLESAREILVQEFARNPTDTADQVHLILAVVLLQTIGLFHQKSDERVSSTIYHVMLVMMIRRTGLIIENTNWIPGALGEVSLEDLWLKWAAHETAKRAILLTYVHDCSHSIYFTLPPSFHPTEVDLKLPCEEALWKAGSATEWYMLLQHQSPYGSIKDRLTGVSMPRVLASMLEPRVLTSPTPCNPFSHFILIHAILRRLFTICTETRNSNMSPTKNADATNSNVCGLQYTLHNWLQSWLNSPEMPRVDDENEESSFVAQALQFYWLGQMSLLAFQEGLPPFESNPTNDMKGETRFCLLKLWLKHIRGFLRHGDSSPTRIWEELMKIRLQTQQPGAEYGSGEDGEGLLGFFPHH